MADTVGSESRKVLLALGGVAGVLFAFYLACECGLDVATRKAVYFWAQMVSGTSWPEVKDGEQHSSLGFAFAATIHSLTTAGPFLGVLWLLWKSITTRSVIMTIATVLQNRDRAIKFAITSVLSKTLTLTPEERSKVTAQLSDAIKEADASWREDLKELIGQDRAKAFLDQLDSQKMVA